MMSDRERADVADIRAATLAMVNDARALVRWWADHMTPDVHPALVAALVAALGEISIEDAMTVLDRESRAATVTARKS